MSVGAVNKQTGARIPTAGMPAIDDALDLTSVNPVQNDIITAALALKQNATDNNLDTEAKTIVGAINEHEGDIDSLKSGFTNLTDAIGWDNHKNIAEPKITSSKTLSGIVLSPVLSDNTITGISIESGTTTGTINETLVAFSVKETGKYNIIGAKLSGEITSNYRTLIWDNTSSVSLIDRITENEFSVTLTSRHNYVIAINTANSVSIPQQTLNIMVCKESQGIIFEPYHPVIGPAVEDLESRIEAVESGLANLGNKVFSAYGTQNADSWYKIGEYVLPEPNYIIHNFIIAIAGTQIKQVTLRCTPTGFNNDLTAVRQVYSDSKNFAIRLASTSKVELYAKVGLRGRHAYSIISEAGNADYKITLSDPVASSYTDTDMYIVN